MERERKREEGELTTPPHSPNLPGGGGGGGGGLFFLLGVGGGGEYSLCSVYIYGHQGRLNPRPIAALILITIFSLKSNKIIVDMLTVHSSDTLKTIYYTVIVE